MKKEITVNTVVTEDKKEAVLNALPNLNKILIPVNQLDNDGRITLYTGKESKATLKESMSYLQDSNMDAELLDGINKSRTLLKEFKALKTGLDYKIKPNEVKQSLLTLVKSKEEFNDLHLHLALRTLQGYNVAIETFKGFKISIYKNTDSFDIFLERVTVGINEQTFTPVLLKSVPSTYKKIEISASDILEIPELNKEVESFNKSLMSFKESRIQLENVNLPMSKFAEIHTRNTLKCIEKCEKSIKTLMGAMDSYKKHMDFTQEESK